MLRNLFLVVPFLLLVHVTSAVALPPCPTDPIAYFDNCKGFYESSNGDTYIGEWRDDEYHGQGTYTWGSGPNIGVKARKKMGRFCFSCPI